MDPATLYLLYTLADGSERMWQKAFPSTETCQSFIATAIKIQPDGVTVVNSVCWPLGKTPPTWVTDRPVYGTPLDPKYRP